ncbi:hypothetical protein IG631_19870 [Alternaria alternata]|nr:hypothetical protein IG631_19870 [Alternaria alternata]
MEEASESEIAKARHLNLVQISSGPQTLRSGDWFLVSSQVKRSVERRESANGRLSQCVAANN